MCVIGVFPDVTRDILLWKQKSNWKVTESYLDFKEIKNLLSYIYESYFLSNCNELLYRVTSNDN